MDDRVDQPASSAMNYSSMCPPDQEISIMNNNDYYSPQGGNSATDSRSPNQLLPAVNIQVCGARIMTMDCRVFGIATISALFQFYYPCRLTTPATMRGI